MSDKEVLKLKWFPLILLILGAWFIIAGLYLAVKY